MLPRWVARLPYDMALWVIWAYFKLGFGARVWNRNSTRTGSFVMGVSDLDITIVYKGVLPFSLLNEALRGFKKFFIFLGEANVYQFAHLGRILPRMNACELKRDPVLEFYRTKVKFPDEIEKFVFTQRMLFSDVFTLRSEPEMRQEKWKQHMKLLGVDTKDKFIDLDFVLNVLKSFALNDSRICSALDEWKKRIFTPGLDIYQTDLGEGFKILAPHLYLWFQSKDERPFLQDLGENDKKIIRRQIDWEFWGLYSQRYHLDHKSIEAHMKRLIIPYKYVAGQEEAERLERDIALVFSV